MSSGRLGHEPSGEIVAVGNSVTGLSVGDRVFIPSRTLLLLLLLFTWRSHYVCNV